METKIATFLSYVFHPLFMPLYMMVVLFNSQTYVVYHIPPQLQKWIYGIVVVNMILMPILVILRLKKKGHINSYEMETTEERRLPMFSTVIFYALTYYFLKNMGLDTLIYMILLGATLSVILAFFITMKWKISAHMMGMGGIVGTTLGLVLYVDAPIVHVLTALVLFSGLVGFARLKLKAHTPAQVYTGFLLGGTVMLGMIMLA